MGLMVMLVVVTVPVCDAVRLLDDPNFAYFVGTRWPAWTIGACVLCIAVYAVTIVAFFALGREEYKTEQTVLMIVTFVATLLGLSLLSLSEPLTKDTLAAYTEIFYSCETGSRTSKLYQTATVLDRLRADPACAELQSVESCAGYQAEEPYTSVLKTLEGSYRCASFCSMALPAAPSGANATAAAPAATTAAPAAASVAAGASFLEGPADGVAATRAGLMAAWRRLGGAGRLQAPGPGRVAALLAVDAEEDGPANAPLGKLGSFSPTLFSRANYQATCEGMLGRSLAYDAANVASLLYVEGVALVATAAAMTLVRLAWTCMDRGPKALPYSAAP